MFLMLYLSKTTKAKKAKINTFLFILYKYTGGYLEVLMKEQGKVIYSHDKAIEESGKKIAYSKLDAVKLNTKCLYAGKLERVKQWQEKSHSHPFCEILFVLSGGGDVFIEGKKYSVKKGDIIVYNPYTEHGEATNSEEGIELAFFGITDFQVGKLPQDHLIDEQAAPILHAGGEAEELDFYFRTLANEVYKNEQYSDIMARYLARLILIKILRFANISEAKLIPNAMFTRIHQYLSTNFAKIESMEQICNELNISKYYLSQVFRQYMGTPPMHYVTLKRISHAKKLLQETNLTATAIGEECGYTDHVLFFKAFKKLEGMTPLAYRKQTVDLRMITVPKDGEK